MIKPLIKKYVIAELENKETKDKVIQIINEKIDIPKLTEKQEQKLFNQIFDALGESLVEIIEKI